MVITSGFATCFLLTILIRTIIIWVQENTPYIVLIFKKKQYMWIFAAIGEVHRIE